MALRPRSSGIALVVALLAGACGGASTDGAGDDPSPPPSPTGDTTGPTVEAPVPPGDGTVLVQQVDGDASLAAVDVADGSVRPIDLPAPCAGGTAGCDARFVVPDGAAGRSLIGTADELFWLDEATGVVTFVTTASELRATDAIRPRRLVATPQGDDATAVVVDVGSGTTTEVPIDRPLQHVVDVHDGVLITTRGGPATVVDTASGTVTTLAETLLAGPQSVDADGRRIAAVDVADRQRHLVVVDLAEPAATERWFTAPNGFVARWVGDRAVVVEPVDGVVSLVDADGASEIARLAPGDVVAPTVYTDPASPWALVQIGPDPIRWYRIDAVAGTVAELTEVAGTEVSHVGVAPPGFVVVGDQQDGPETVRLAAVPIEPGAVVEMFAADDPTVVATEPVGEHRVYVWSLGPREAAWIVDLRTGARDAAVVGSNPTASADGSYVALTVGSGTNRSAVVVPVDRPTAAVELAAGWAVGWLAS